MIEQILFDKDARQSLMKGIELLAKAVMTTYGCAGRNVITGGHDPRSSRDGIFVANNIVFADRSMNQGATLVRQASKETMDSCGDGTTQSCLLSYRLIQAAEKYLSAGANPNSLKRGMDIAAMQIIKQLKEMSHPCDTTQKIVDIATISGNNDPFIGKIVGTAYEYIGRDGMVKLENSKSAETYVEHKTGLQIESGFMSPYFVNTEKFTCELSGVCVILLAQEISKIEGEPCQVDEKGVLIEGTGTGLLGILDRCAQTGVSVLIVGKEVDGEVVGSLYSNKKILPSCVVRAPYFGTMQKELLQDIAAATGATPIDNELGLDAKTMDWTKCGYAEKVIVERGNTVFIGGAGNPKARVEVLKSEYELTKDEVLRKRLARLSGGVSVIHVGAATEVAQKELKDRFDDSFRSVKVAIEDGIVEGGGVALLRCSVEYTGANKDENNGIRVVESVLSAPITQILSNAGLTKGKKFLGITTKKDEISEVIDVVKSTGKGFDAKKMTYVDMITDGIVDPLAVLKAAINNSVSVAGVICLSGAVLIDEQD